VPALKRDVLTILVGEDELLQSDEDAQ